MMMVLSPMSEVKNVVFHMNGNSASGFDGFGDHLYHTYGTLLVQMCLPLSFKFSKQVC